MLLQTLDCLSLGFLKWEKQLCIIVSLVRRMWTELNICESGRQMGCYRTFSFMVIKWGLLSRAPGTLMVPFQEGIVNPTVSSAWFHALSQNPKWLFHKPPTRSLGLLSPLWMNLLWLLLSSSLCLSAIRDSSRIDTVLQFRGAVSVLGEQMLLGAGADATVHGTLSLAWAIPKSSLLDFV